MHIKLHRFARRTHTDSHGLFLTRRDAPCHCRGHETMPRVLWMTGLKRKMNAWTLAISDRAAVSCPSCPARDTASVPLHFLMSKRRDPQSKHAPSQHKQALDFCTLGF